MQIIDVPDRARITIVRKAGDPAPETDYMLVPASMWDEMLADHVAWQYVITPDTEKVAAC